MSSDLKQLLQGSGITLSPIYPTTHPSLLHTDLTLFRLMYDCWLIDKNQMYSPIMGLYF